MKTKNKVEYEPDKKINEITNKIIGAAIEVHSTLGPGLLESAYELCLLHELTTRGLNVERQKEIPINYKEININCGYRLDLLVENSVIVELKSVKFIEDVHRAQLLSYLRLSGCRVGLLINFNEKILKDGICRLAN